MNVNIQEQSTVNKLSHVLELKLGINDAMIRLRSGNACLFYE